MAVFALRQSADGSSLPEFGEERFGWRFWDGSCMFLLVSVPTAGLWHSGCCSWPCHAQSRCPCSTTHGHTMPGHMGQIMGCTHEANTESGSAAVQNVPGEATIPQHWEQPGWESAFPAWISIPASLRWTMLWANNQIKYSGAACSARGTAEMDGGNLGNSICTWNFRAGLGRAVVAGLVFGEGGLSS